MARKIKNLKTAQGEIFYPTSHIDGIVDDNGNTVYTMFTNFQQQINEEQNARADADDVLREYIDTKDNKHNVYSFKLFENLNESSTHAQIYNALTTYFEEFIAVGEESINKYVLPKVGDTLASRASKVKPTNHEVAEIIAIEPFAYSDTGLSTNYNVFAITYKVSSRERTITIDQSVANAWKVSSVKVRYGALSDLFINAGATYDVSTDQYTLNGITDLTFDEMLTIYNNRLVGVGAINGSQIRGRTNFEFPSASNSYVYDNINVTDDVEVLNLGGFFAPAKMQGCIPKGDKLRQIIGTGYQNGISQIAVIGTNCTEYTYGTFSNLPLLENIRIYGLRANISFAGSPNLSYDSILFMIMYNDVNNALGSSASIIITLHETAYNRAISMGIEDWLDGYPQIILAKA